MSQLRNLAGLPVKAGTQAVYKNNSPGDAS